MADRDGSLREIAAETVLGLDNAPITFPIAGVGSRVLAAILDGLLQLSLQIGAAFRT